MVVEWMHLNEVSKICGQERVWSSENCVKRKFMYKAVDKKKISAGIGCRIGRKVYTSRDTWSCNEDIQKYVVHYEVTKMRMGTEELKLGQSKKSLFKLIISKSHTSLLIVMTFQTL